MNQTIGVPLSSLSKAFWPHVVFPLPLTPDEPASTGEVEGTSESAYLINCC